MRKIDNSNEAIRARLDAYQAERARANLWTMWAIAAVVAAGAVCLFTIS